MGFKVAINKCFGGFGLSDEAVVAIYERKGIEVYPIKERWMTWFFDVEPSEEIVKQATSTAPYDERPEYREFYQKHHLPDEFARDDPDMIAVIEEFGDAANGQHAQLKIVELPDDVQGRWDIDEYDGMEHIAEDHRTWG